MYYIYLIECGDGTIYTGITTDIARRFSEHQDRTASKYTASRGVKRVVYVESCGDRSAALKREAEIKRLSRAKKIELASQYDVVAQTLNTEHAV